MARSNTPRFSLQWLAPVAALVLLTWGALPYLPGQIDDPFIVFAYAHRLVDVGEISWNTGERVEGYSSALHLGLMGLAAWAGLDLSVFARAFSFAAALWLLTWANQVVRGRGRGWFLVALACWQPLQFWSTAGMETAFAALLGAVGWTNAVGDRRDWGRGTVLLAAYSLVRPEGLAWLVASLLRRLLLGPGRGRPEALAAMALGLLIVYHAIRITYFGAVLPTPFLVKLEAVHPAFDGPGFTEATRELLSASGILIVVFAHRSGGSGWAWVPLALQTLLLVRAGGDWMGNARFLLPGVIASGIAAWRSSVERATVRPIWWLVMPLLLAVSFMWEPSRMGRVGDPALVTSGLRDRYFLQHPSDAVTTPWSVPLLEEAAFLVGRIPEGSGAALSDVGLPGNLTDVRIWDNTGLTDRETAEVIANPNKTITAALRARYDDPDDIWCIRYGLADDGSETADPWLVTLMPEVTPSTTPSLIWRCRPGGEPSAAVVIRRWMGLVRRFPSQDWLHWHLGRALLAGGDSDRALAEVERAPRLSADGPGWLLFGGNGTDHYEPRRGWAMYANSELVSQAVDGRVWASLRAALDVDDPGDEGAKVRVRWIPECGAALELRVPAPTRFALPACDASGARRLSVEFLNDKYQDDSDRNLYVGLVGP